MVTPMPILHLQSGERFGLRGSGFHALAIRALVTGIAVFLAITIVPGIDAHTFSAGLAAVLMLTFLNTLLRPILYLLSFPLIILSFGLFTVIVNALLLQSTAYLVKGFEVAGFWASVWGALLISLVSTLLNFWKLNTPRVETSSSPDRPPRIINPE
jgi:putative membrane protein